MGWIRQLLEWSVYLLISVLYDHQSPEADWILNDYQDNLYMKPPFGYLIADMPSDWFNRGGFSIQPNLLAGLMPYLDRDEPEVYIWMFFNAWCSCYREEINAMAEHPAPVLGYSNHAQFKTSDEANAVMWLRYMYVYALKDLLHFGRAIPRQWFEDGNSIEAKDVATFFGNVGVRYESLTHEDSIAADVQLALRDIPGRTLVRFRHPEKKKIVSAEINGERTDRFDPVKGDVDISGMKGKVKIEVGY